MTRLTLPQNNLVAGSTESRLFDAWQPANAVWIYGSAASLDSGNQFEGSDSLLLEYDATANNCRADWKIAGSGPAAVRHLGIHFKNTTGHILWLEILLDTSTTFATYCQCTVPLVPGSDWDIVWISPQNFVSASVLYAGGSWIAGSYTQVQQIRVRGATQSATEINGWQAGDSVNIGPLVLRQSRKRPKCIITFDDALESVYDNRAWMSDRNLKGTCYTYPGALGGTGYMTGAELDALYALGWDVCNHSNEEYFTLKTAQTATGTPVFNGTDTVTITMNISDHRLSVGDIVAITGITPNYNGNKVLTAVNGAAISYAVSDLGAASGTATVSQVLNTLGLSTYTYDECLASLQAAQDLLLSRGYTRSYQHFAYPQGVATANINAALNDMGMKTARLTLPNGMCEYPQRVFWPATAESSLWDEYFGALGASCLTTTSKTIVLGGIVSVESSQTLADIYHQIDAAIEDGRTIFTLTHTLSSGDSAHHQAWMDYIVAKRDAGLLDVVTISEWYDGLTQPRQDGSSRATTSSRASISAARATA